MGGVPRLTHGPHGLVLRLLTLTGLNQVLGVYPSVTVASTARPRGRLTA